MESERVSSKVVRLDAENRAEVIQLAAEVIRGEGIIAYLSDTVYGLGCDPWSKKALERLFQAKGRSPDKGVLLLISSVEMATPLVDHFPSAWSTFSRHLWPGPFTLLLPASWELPERVRGRAGKVGLRIPGSTFLREWLEAIPGPVVSTSANPSGRNIPASFEEVFNFFDGKVDLFIDGGKPARTMPSTVIDLCTSPPKIVRKGDQADLAIRLIASFRKPQ